MLLMEAWAIKDRLFQKKWYGLKITAHPDGRHQVEFNHDPDCINDPGYYDELRQAIEEES